MYFVTRNLTVNRLSVDLRLSADAAAVMRDEKPLATAVEARHGFQSPETLSPGGETLLDFLYEDRMRAGGDADVFRKDD